MNPPFRKIKQKPACIDFHLLESLHSYMDNLESIWVFRHPFFLIFFDFLVFNGKHQDYNRIAALIIVLSFNAKR